LIIFFFVTNGLCHFINPQLWLDFGVPRWLSNFVNLKIELYYCVAIGKAIENAFIEPNLESNYKNTLLGSKATSRLSILINIQLTSPKGSFIWIIDRECADAREVQ
jgi:hypothetical protein